MNTEDVGVVAALAALPNITPRRLSLLLSFGSPDHVWLALRGDTECAGVLDIASLAVHTVLRINLQLRLTILFYILIHTSRAVTLLWPRVSFEIQAHWHRCIF